MYTASLVFAVVSMVVSGVGWGGAIANPSGKTPVVLMLGNTFKMFDRENFTERGNQWRKVYLLGTLGWVAGFAAVAALAPS